MRALCIADDWAGHHDGTPATTSEVAFQERLYLTGQADALVPRIRVFDIAPQCAPELADAGPRDRAGWVEACQVTGWHVETDRGLWVQWGGLVANKGP